MLGSKGLPQSHESVSSNIFAGSLSRLKCFIRSGGCCIPSRAVAYSWLPLSTTRFWSWLSILWSLSWRNLLLLFCNSILRTLCEDLVYKGCSSHSERSPASFFGGYVATDRKLAFWTLSFAYPRFFDLCHRHCSLLSATTEECNYDASRLIIVSVLKFCMKKDGKFLLSEMVSYFRHQRIQLNVKIEKSILCSTLLSVIRWRFNSKMKKDDRTRRQG